MQKTWQVSDSTGLFCYNARYYDPTLGTFISPDTLVPDAGVLFDYNRFMYTRGNPLKYTDPSGHCATIASTGAPDRNNDPDCWRYVDSILNVWDEESPYGYEYGYWERRFTSKEVFGLMAQQSFNDTGFFMQEFNRYNDYKDAADREMSELLQEYAQHNPSAGRDFFHPCLEVWDCRSLGYALCVYNE